MSQINLVSTTNQNNVKTGLTHLGGPMWYWDCPMYLDLDFPSRVFSECLGLVASVVRCSKPWNSDAIRYPLMRSDVEIRPTEPSATWKVDNVSEQAKVRQCTAMEDLVCQDGNLGHDALANIVLVTKWQVTNGIHVFVSTCRLCRLKAKYKYSSLKAKSKAKYFISVLKHKHKHHWAYFTYEWLDWVSV